MEDIMKKTREEIADVCHKLWQRGIVAANDGNVSVKLPDGTILCTPSGISKAEITPDMLLHVTSDLELLSARQGMRPSSELKMHLRCYETRSDIGAVVHAQPPFATVFAGTNVPLDQYGLSEAVICLG